MLNQDKWIAAAMLLLSGAVSAQTLELARPAGTCESLPGCLKELGYTADAQTPEPSATEILNAAQKGALAADRLPFSQKLLPNNVFDERDGQFGTTIQFEGDLAVVSAPFLGASRSAQYGFLFVFERNVGGPDNWGRLTGLADRLSLPGSNRIKNQNGAGLGASVSLSGNILAFSAPDTDLNDSVIADSLGTVGIGRTDVGAVFIYEFIPLGDPECPVEPTLPDDSSYCTLIRRKVFLPSGANSNARFGRSLVVDDDTLVVSAPGLETNLNAGLVAHYPFNQGQGGADQVGGNNGTLLDGAVITADSRIGDGALDLRSPIDGYMSLPAWPLGVEAEECTVAAWISTEDQSAGFQGGIVTSVDATAVDGFRMRQSDSNFGLVLQGTSGTTVVDAPGAADNTWTHVAVSFSRLENNSKVYINGVDSGTFDYGFNAEFFLGRFEGYCGSATALVGAEDFVGTGTITNYFNGRIDDLRFYNRRLNTTELSDLVNESTTLGFGALLVYEKNLGGPDQWGERTRIYHDGTNSAFGLQLDLDGDQLIRVDGNPTQAFLHSRDQGGVNAWQEVLEYDPPVGFSFIAQEQRSAVALVGDQLFFTGGSLTVGGRFQWRYSASTGVFQQALNGCSGGEVISASVDRLIAGTGVDTCVFDRNQGGADAWGLTQTIPNPQGGGLTTIGFGDAVSLAGDELMIGAPTFDKPNSNALAGRVFLHSKDQGGTDAWGEVTPIDRGLTERTNRLGISMDQDGNVLVVGSNAESNTRRVGGGTAYVFERESANAPWQFVTKLQPGDVGGVEFNGNGNMGFDVAVSGNTIVVSDSSHSSTGRSADGIALIYEKMFGEWTLSKLLRTPDNLLAQNTLENNGFLVGFAYNLDIEGDTIAVGLRFATLPPDTFARGFVYYRDEGGSGNWGLAAELASDAGDSMGFDVALSPDENLVIMGAPSANGSAGAAYIFERDLGGADAWGRRTKLEPAQLVSQDRFGRTVAIDETRAVVGAPNASPTVGQVETGKVFVFNRNAGGADTWALEDIDTPSLDLPFQNMGVGLSLEGDMIALGAPSFGDAFNIQQGSVILFEFDPADVGDPWKEIAAIQPTDGFTGNLLGRSIDFSDRTVSVGASFDSELDTESGAAYVFQLPDLTVNGVTGPSQAEAGSSVTLTITPGNAGDGAAADGILTADLPAQCASLSAASATDGWSASNPQAGVLRLTRTIPSLAADGSAALALTLDAASTSPVASACSPLDIVYAVNNIGTTGTPDYFLQNDQLTGQLTLVEPINQPPAGAIPDLSFSAGVPITIDFNDYFTDPNGDAITYAASGLPPSVTLNAQTGVASGTTTAADFNNSPFVVNVTATDVPAGANSAPAQFTLTLTNSAPIESFPLPTYTTVVGEDLLIDLTPHFADADGQTLQYSLSGSPAYTVGNFGIASLIRGVATTTQLQQSPLSLNVTVSDGFGQQVVRQLTINVQDQLAPNFQFERFFPALQQPWYFSDVQDVQAAPDGTVYLADAERGKVLRFSKDGLLVTQWGQLGSDPGQFTFLSLKLGVGPDGLVYTASGSRLQVFGKNGDFISEIDLVDDLIDLTLDLNNRLYLLLSDGLGQRVEIRDAADIGLIVDTVSVNRPPSSIAVTDGGRIYVALRSPGSAENNDQIIPYDPPTYAPGTPIATTDADDLALDMQGQLFAVGDQDGVLRAYDAAGGLQEFTDVSAVGGGSLRALTFGLQNRRFISNGPTIFGVESNSNMRQFAWQSASSEVGRFRRPLDLSRDAGGNIYVVEAEQSRVQRFSRDGDILAGWSLQQPIADPANARVYVHATRFSPARVLVSTGSALELFDTSGNFIANNPFDPGGLAQPGPIDQTTPGNMVITDTGGAGTQVWIIDSAGVQQVTPWTAPNCNATAMATGLNNLIYLLCEPGFAAREVQVFSENGQPISNATITLPPGNPRGLSIDDNGRLFLLNTENEINLGFGITSADSLIRVYRADGQDLGQIGSSGYSAGRFDFGGEVAGMDIGDGGEIIVAEPGNNRVQIFTPQLASRNSKAIVVAGGGDYPENFLWEATQINANNAYDKLIYQGFTEDRIQYLHPDPGLDLDGNPATQEVDGAPTLLNLQEAITTWAADADNLVLYLADHGNKEVFRLNPEEIIDSGTLSDWIAQLQDATWPGRSQPPVGNNGWISVVYEACESGTFQDNLAPQNSIATNKRLVITTSSSDENASFIAQGLLSFSYQFWINVFNGENVLDAFELASATISDAYPQQSPLLSLVDGGNRVSDLNSYFNNGGTNASFAGRFIGNGTTNSFAGPQILNPSATLLSGSTARIDVQTVLSDNGVSRVWAIIEPPGYQVRDSENPILELPTIDLQASCTSGSDYCAEFSGFTTVGDYRLQFLAQDVFGTVSSLAGSQVTLTVGNPLRNKAALLIAGGSDGRGAARVANGDFAYQALLRQDFVNDLDPDSGPVTSQEDEIRYYTQGQFLGADVGSPGSAVLNNLVTSGFADANTQHLALVIMADYDSSIDALVFPDLPPLSVADLDSFLASAEQQIQGKLTLILDGDGAGAVIPRLAGSNNRRLLVSSTSPGEAAKLLGAGGISFSKFFWNAIRDGFSVGTAFQLASSAISQGVGEQNPMLDDNGNGISNDPEDQLASRAFFLGPGLARAGNGPLVGRLAPDLTISAENQFSRTIVAEDVSSLSSNAVSVRGSVSVPGTQLQVGEFELTPINGVQKGQQVINLGDYSGTFDGFVAAGDYDVSVFAVDDKGNPSTPQRTRVRKTAGGDIFELDNSATASTPVVIDAAPQRHTLHLADDEDWLVFYLTDSNVRVLDLNFNELDPGLRISLEVFADDRLLDDTAAPVLSSIIDPGSAGTDISIPNSLAAGLYLARISRQSFIPQPDSDPSPGYSVGLSSPFGALGGLLRGQVVDATTGAPVGLARVAAITGDGAFCGSPPCEASVAPSCDRASCGEQGGFLMFLNQGSYDVQVSAPGYESALLSGFAVEPGGTTLVTPGPIALTPETGTLAPAVTLSSAAADGEISALLNGTINANGAQTTGRFLLGLDGQNLNELTPGYLVLGSTPETVTSRAMGLTCETTYVARLAAENAGGQVETSDLSFTTAACGTTGLNQIFKNGFE